MSAVSSPVAPELLRRALREIRTLKAQVKELRSAKSEPIAVVGMACRFPGAHDVDAFWDLLARGGDAITRCRPSAGTSDAYYDPTRTRRARCTRGGAASSTGSTSSTGVLRHRAARGGAMDPQQRLLLEVAWQALENAGSPRTRLAGSTTGVFVGVGATDYSQLPVCSGTAAIDPYTGTGNACGSRPGGSPMSSACTDRASRSTRPAPRRWWRCTWPARACAAASARWRWPAAST